LGLKVKQQLPIWNSPLEREEATSSSYIAVAVPIRLNGLLSFENRTTWQISSILKTVYHNRSGFCARVAAD
jgi:hypothetical protein